MISRFDVKNEKYNAMIIILEISMFFNFYVFFDIITEIYIPHGTNMKLPVYC